MAPKAQPPVNPKNRQGGKQATEHLDLSHLAHPDNAKPGTTPAAAAPAQQAAPAQAAPPKVTPAPAQQAAPAQAAPPKVTPAPAQQAAPAQTAPPKVTPAPAQQAQAPAQVATTPTAPAEEEEPIPPEYVSPTDEAEMDDEDDPDAPQELDENFEAPTPAMMAEEEEFEDEEDEATPTPATQEATVQPEPMPSTNSDAINLARQFLQQRDTVAIALRQEAAGKRDEAHQIIQAAQEKAQVLVQEAAEAEAFAASLAGGQVSAPASSTPGQPSKRRRRKQGVPNLPASNDTTAPVAAPSVSHARHNPAPPVEEPKGKGSLTRKLNVGKSVRLGVLTTLQTHRCIRPGKTMSLQPLSEWIVRKPEQGGYGYTTQSDQFGNIVRGQLDKLENEGKIIFDDATGGYYLAPNATAT